MELRVPALRGGSNEVTAEALRLLCGSYTEAGLTAVLWPHFLILLISSVSVQASPSPPASASLWRKASSQSTKRSSPCLYSLCQAVPVLNALDSMLALDTQRYALPASGILCLISLKLFHGMLGQPHQVYGSTTTSRTHWLSKKLQVQMCNSPSTWDSARLSARQQPRCWAPEGEENHSHVGPSAQNGCALVTGLQEHFVT